MIGTTWETVFVAFGSNINDPIRQLCRARARLRTERGLRETGISRLYRTAPWGYAAQDDFYNAVVRYQCALSPTALLALLQQVELAQGRTRPFKNAPRSLDLDILLYGHKNIASSMLTIPHPALLARIFVLAPLNDLNPEWLIGETTVGAALAALPWEGIAVVANEDWQ